MIYNYVPAQRPSAQEKKTSCLVQFEMCSKSCLSHQLIVFQEHTNQSGYLKDEWGKIIWFKRGILVICGLNYRSVMNILMNLRRHFQSCPSVLNFLQISLLNTSSLLQFPYQCYKLSFFPRQVGCHLTERPINRTSRYLHNILSLSKTNPSA
jgi:hypothetical protein